MKKMDHTKLDQDVDDLYSSMSFSRYIKNVGEKVLTEHTCICYLHFY